MEKKGYIRRIANGVFIFADAALDEMYLFYLANRIYEPSYISLESAFDYYSFIPDTVYRITSVGTKKTSEFRYHDIAFNYRCVQRRLHFGYRLVLWRNLAVKVADPQKAVLDYFYLNSEIKTKAHVEDMRFNTAEMRRLIDWKGLYGYLRLFNNKALSKRIQLFKESMQND